MIFICCTWAFGKVSAQQDPVYAQYLNNPFVINPAYAGSNDRLNATLQYRTQWSGVQGHPETFNFNSHLSLKENKIGAGLMVVQDKIGENTTNDVEAAAAYKIDLTGGKVFSFGMQFGMMRFTNSLNGLNLQPGDPYFTLYNVSKFNTGAGLMLKSDRFFIGLSAPHLLPVTVDQGAGQHILVYDRTYYLLGSYMIYLTERVRLRPAVLLRASDNFKPTADLNLNLQIEDFYSVGIFTRNLNTYGMLFQIIVKNYRFGYVIEVPGSKSAIPFTTNEFMLGISLRALSFHHDSFTVF
ncbi:MAG: PorP/SprF family type IX secretion system membrane protein [Bacteroidetes bacterium]|nr:PorP/SprF family type IX secretion system membrane protein [Bacteroidota bacterium]MBS1980901.1 PorP/SprF family type IX secretion system membrane protein [Bacteroidota bacterium]